MPSDEENWMSVNYSEILSMLEGSIELKKEYINPSVTIFLEQYKHMIRRDIIMDEELVAICTEIYNKHQKALDLIYEYKQDNDMQIKKIIDDTLAKYDDIEMDHSNKAFIRFYTKTIDSVIPKDGEGWTKSNRILLYEFQNKGGKIVLKLILGPVKDNDNDIRERIFELANENKNIFRGTEAGCGFCYCAILFCSNGNILTAYCSGGKPYGTETLQDITICRFTR